MWLARMMRRSIMWSPVYLNGRGDYHITRKTAMRAALVLVTCSDAHGELVNTRSGLPVEEYHGKFQTHLV